MEILAKIRIGIGSDWIPEIYTELIRPLRTRSFEMDIPERENHPEMFETLLGMELKVGRRRFACPDANTARYLYVFACLGCRNIAVPYDITVLGGLADRFEGAWNKTVDVLERRAQGLTPQQKGRVRAALLRSMRDEIKAAGAGDLMPLFNRSTRQRDD
jgi:hypothetical protein